jgi:hypothetical protein
MVIEPGELAGDEDIGATAGHPGSNEAQRAADVVEQALAPGVADEAGRRSARLEYSDGAAAIARLIEGQLASVRTARPLAWSLPRL